MLNGRLEHDYAAETALVSGVLRYPACLTEVLPVVRAEHFRHFRNLCIFQASTAILDRGGTVTLVTVAEELIRRGQVKDVGGYAGLAGLWESAPCGNFLSYAEVVRDRGTLYRLHAAATEIAAAAKEGRGPAAEILAEAERSILAVAEGGVVGQAVPACEIVAECKRRIDERATGRGLRGLGTAWVDLDRLTTGLQDSELVIVAARPSVGKTALGLNLARFLAVDRGLPVLFASLEQSRHEVGERLMSAQSRINSQLIRTARLSPHEAAQLARAGDAIAEAPLFIDDTCGQRVMQIAANARRLKAGREGLRAVIVDYLQMVEPDDREESRERQVAAVTRRLKQLARELAIPVVALAQLNRLVEGRKGNEPKLSDLRESGAIEMDADTVLLLHRPDEQGAALNVNVAKQRNGPTGEIQLYFDKACQRLENGAREGYVMSDGEVVP